MFLGKYVVENSFWITTGIKLDMDDVICSMESSSTIGSPVMKKTYESLAKV